LINIKSCQPANTSYNQAPITKLKQEELNKIIESLQSNDSKDIAGLGFYYIGGDTDEAYIKANKAGLELFAAELLKAAVRIDEIKNGDIETLSININHDWIDNHIPLLYIQPVIDYERKNVEIRPKNWKDSVLKYGCVFTVGVVIISFVVGIITIIKWL